MYAGVQEGIIVQHYRRPKNTHRDSTKPPPPITKADTPTHKTNLQKNHQHPWLRRPPIKEIKQSITTQEQKNEVTNEVETVPQPTKTNNKPKQPKQPKKQATTNQDSQGKTQPRKGNKIITAQKKATQHQKRIQRVKTNTKLKTKNNRRKHAPTKGTNMRQSTAQTTNNTTPKRRETGQRDRTNSNRTTKRTRNPTSQNIQTIQQGTNPHNPR